MTPVVFFVVLLLLTAVPPGATDEGDDGDSSQDVSEVIARANANITTKLIYDDIAPNTKWNAVPCTAIGCKWRKRGRYVTVPYTISSEYSTDERNFIIKTLESFHQSTCVRFQMRTSRQFTYLHFFSGTGTNNLGTPYDFQSVMHYSKYAFSKNGQPTIVAKSDPKLNFGHATTLSANDIARVNRLYKC
ncbi:high choriolytic enzyme 1-like [Scomber scombrus]|uniref:High choriolytic enzyme 1-like n=1 Tax=Scomber scombrus TaxID=13677 RepID=A0AAV1Q102_SCOSC